MSSNLFSFPLIFFSSNLRKFMFSTREGVKGSNFFFKNQITSNPYLNKLLNLKKIIKLFLKSIFLIFFWNKARFSYYINNWIYTTNHKRIAVNYFWFVILSGIVGMVLATVMRLEFSYPGVGVFAGDSIQYLSLASAHGVIMVFFMIMPLLFGAFANFLLPTQLGVHDVAFPRLNSAAFWFLPGGLLMLCQLVCIDRRYQRMNCFNVREIQSLLKRKFFTDLVNSRDHRILLDKTSIGNRYKINFSTLQDSNLSLSYIYGLDATPKLRSNRFLNQTQDYFFYKNLNFNQYEIFIFNEKSYFFKLINFSLNSKFFYTIYNFFFNFLMFGLGLCFINFAKYAFFLVSNVFNSIYAFFKNLICFVNNSFNVLINTLAHIFFDLISNTTYALKQMISVVVNSISSFSLYRVDFYSIFFLTPADHYRKTVLNLNKISPTFFNFSEKKNQTWRLVESYLQFYFTTTQYVFYQKRCFYITIVINQMDLLTKAYWILLNSCRFFYNKMQEFVFKVIDDCKNFVNSDILKKLDIIKSNFFPKPKIIHLSAENFWPINPHFINTFPPLFHSLILIKFFFFAPLFFFKYLFRNLSIFFLNNYSSKELSELEYFEYTYNYIFSLFSPLWNSYSFFFFIDKSSRISLSKNPFRFGLGPSKDPLAVWFRAYYDHLMNEFYLYTGVEFKFFLFVLFRSFWSALSNFFLFLFLWLKFFFLNCFLFFETSFNYFINYFSIRDRYTKNRTGVKPTKKHRFNSSYFYDYSLKVGNLSVNEETGYTSRDTSFNNPVFKYDYKSGDYFPKLHKEVYPYLISSIANLTSGLKTSPWFFSYFVFDNLVDTFSYFEEKFNNLKNFQKLGELKLEKKNKFSNDSPFYNFFCTLASKNEINSQFLSVNSLNFKFQKMFLASSMQQRIYSNWRQLKFTREAWRCKLLISRHQKSLFRRYLNEDGVFWSIERNAKDLIPGWAMITPFSSRTRFTAVGKTDIGLMGVLLVLNSSIISGANFLVTYRYLSTLNNRKMRDARSFFTEAVMVSSWMMILANPMLIIGIIMLLSDRHWQTSFFDYSGGGDTVLFQHMFWFFGHPEVYIIILPTFGFTNTMLSFYLKKRVSARASLLYSMYTIAFLGFFVWGNHMYMVGLSHTTRMLFSTLTVMISVPAATKIMHWCVTTVNSSFTMELPLLFTFTFIFFFVSGGISGMCVAHTGMDVLFHDTFYVIGHFHVMLAGAAMFASFGAFYFYFPAIFGVKYSRIYAYLHYSYYLIGQLMTVIPMFWLGYAGMPRRVLDYPSSFGGWHSVISAGHMLNVAGLIAFFIMIFDSLRQSRAASRNSYGIGRFNTRLNFYLYENAKTTAINQKSFVLFKLIKKKSIRLKTVKYDNYEPMESTLISYVFTQKQV